MTGGRVAQARATLGRLDREASTADERDRDRHRRIAVATVAGLASKVLVAGALLISVPLAAHHLTPAELGVWTILVSAVALVGWTDLGLGNGLLNLLNEALGRDDPAAVRRAVAAALVGLTAVAVAMGVVAMLAVALVPWESLFGLAPHEVDSLRPAVAAFALVILVSVPASLGQRIHLAYQQGWAASVSTGAGSALSIVGVWAAARAGASLPVFVLAMLGGSTAAYLAETVWVLGRSHRDLLPRPADLHRATLRRLLRSGTGFFALTLASSLAYQTDALVIANHLGAAEATTYVLTNRLFTLAPTALSTLLLPLWPAYGEAISRGDHHWVRRTLSRSLTTSLAISAAAALLLVAITRPLLAHWAPSTTPPSTDLLLASACWSVVMSVSFAVAMYLNGAHLIRFQLSVSSVMAIANLGASIVLVRTIGIAGPIWASVVTQTAIVLVPAAVVLQRALRDVPAQHVGTTTPIPTPGVTP